MDTRSGFRIPSITPVLVLLAMAAVLWPIGSGADEGEQRLDGSWSVTVTATSPPLAPFSSLMTFTRGGGVVESRRLYLPDSPFGPLLETPGHGEWVRTGSREFTIGFTFLLQGAPDNLGAAGDLLGTDNIMMRIKLAASGETFNGEFRSEIRDLDDNLVFVAEGDVDASRIRTQPCPWPVSD